jgi:cell division protein FtsQ
MHRADSKPAGYSDRRRFSRPGSGVAKVERQFSRAGASLAEDDTFDEVFRPHAVSRPRPSPSFPEAGPLRPDADDDELPVLRTRRRVQPKRGFLPQERLGRILLLCGVVVAVSLTVALCVAVHSFFMTDARFRIDTASSIQVLGNSQVTRPELLSVFGGDIGRNIFHVPLGERRAELEQLPWVEHATVMRLLPNQLRVSVIERIPVAFVRAGNHIGLIDRSGVLLDMPPAIVAAKHYSFPVVTGVTGLQPSEDRASRMQLYADFMNALTSTGDPTTGQLSEVDLSDPEDIRALLPSAGSDLLVHFGSDDYANRWQTLEQKLPGWRQQYPRLAGVDLRYQRQTVLEMAKEVAEPATSPTPGTNLAHATSAVTKKSVVRPPAQRRAIIQANAKGNARRQAMKTSAAKKAAHSTKAQHGAPQHAAKQGTRG